MLATLIIFVVDLMLASAVVITLYSVCLIAATSIFISVIFYIYKREMKINCDFNQDRTRAMLDSTHATGEMPADHVEQVSCRLLPGHFAAVQEKAFLCKESNAVFYPRRSPAQWKNHRRRLGISHPQPTNSSFFR